MLRALFLIALFLMTNCGIKGKPLPPMILSSQETEKPVDIQKNPRQKAKHQ